MIIVSIQRDDVVFIDYIDKTKGKTIEDEREKIIANRGQPLKEKSIKSGAISLDYWSKKYKLHETVMVCKA